MALSDLHIALEKSELRTRAQSFCPRRPKSMPPLSPSSIPAKSPTNIGRQLLKTKNTQATIDITMAVFEALSQPYAHLLQRLHFGEFESDPLSSEGEDLKSYVAFVVDDLTVEAGVFFAALVYLTRIHAAYPDLPITCRNFPRLWIVSLILASKFLLDIRFAIDDWSFLSKIPSKQLREAECEFLDLLKWEMHVSGVELEQFIRRWFSLAGLRQARSQISSLSPRSASLRMSKSFIHLPQQNQQQHHFEPQAVTKAVEAVPDSASSCPSASSKSERIKIRIDLPIHNEEHDDVKEADSEVESVTANSAPEILDLSAASAPVSACSSAAPTPVLAHASKIQKKSILPLHPTSSSSSATMGLKRIASVTPHSMQEAYGGRASSAGFGRTMSTKVELPPLRCASAASIRDTRTRTAVSGARKIGLGVPS